MDEPFDSAGLALCCAAAIRLGGAVRVLAGGAGLGPRYDVVAAGLEHVVDFLGGREREVDRSLLGPAFGMNWALDGEYPAGLPGAAFFRSAGTVVFIAFVAARPDQQIAPAQGLTAAVEATAAWPSEVDPFTSLADFEPACRREAAERLRTDGLPALWELAREQSERYRRVAETLAG
ncbi:hypothetical protein [Streptomyces sp. NPDC088794]|uniref:hypothetical protein n=1 Tax=Streptomyces sp. NPDC088794 TaxID=3365902 RepID=UPI0037F6D0FD